MAQTVYNNSEVKNVYTTTIANAQRNLQTLIDMTLDGNELINIASDKGNVLIINEQEYRNLILTLEVEANPVFKQSLVDAVNDIDNAVDEKDVIW
jgi:PHD/YefM family antitoxin component YafN of YafNO toxin-antitoxin module